MKPPPPPRDPATAATAGYLAELAAIAAEHGIGRTGVAGAGVMHRARRSIHDRIADGHADGMQFTFKNPERSTDPARAVRGARAVFVGARSYLAEEPAGGGGARPRGRIARYAWSDHYGALREGLGQVAARLRRDGWKAVVFADDNSVVDRDVAHRAGLGWYGKNANLLVAGAGSWFVLGSVVTDAPLPAATDVVPDGCGSCTRCLDHCPTGAIVAPGVVDASRCLSWLLQKPGVFDRRYREALGDRLYGCDDCQEVCPPTVRLGARHRAPVGTAAVTGLDLVDLLCRDDAGLLGTWGRWYLADRDPRWIRRNALLALANSVAAMGHEQRRAVIGEVAAVLRRYLAHDDPILRAHAVWSARRAGLGDLVPASDDDPLVRAELVAPG